MNKVSVKNVANVQKYNMMHCIKRLEHKKSLEILEGMSHHDRMMLMTVKKQKIVPWKCELIDIHKVFKKM